ncbi:Fic/DOC family protein [Paenalkalicoccus suaedae]|nr:Fic family protein [Paenalkalicoccus suaedae]
MQLDAMFTSKRLSELQLKELSGRLDFSHFKEIHRYIFQDLYPFAGKLREENISKDGFTFAQWTHLEENGEELFTKLLSEDWAELTTAELVHALAHYLAEINVLHPFREGNGRATREYIRQLARRYGFAINWSRVDNDRILQASIRSTYDEGPLRDVLLELLS